MNSCSIEDEQTSPLSSPLYKSKTEAELTLYFSSGKKQIIKEYEICSELGRGSYAKVYMARSLIDSSKVAIKIIDKEFLTRVRIFL